MKRAVTVFLLLTFLLEAAAYAETSADSKQEQPTGKKILSDVACPG
jgi:hypothetical protein